MILAAIDIGSNAARLFICSFYSKNSLQKFKTVEYIRVPIRLGDCVFQHGTIIDSKRIDLIKMMVAFKSLIELYKVDSFKAVATSALREAANSKEIIDEIEKYTQIKIDVISGEDEARLIFQAHKDKIPENKKIVFVDVGGGSTEISLLVNKERVSSRSFPIGTVRILDNCDNDSDWKAMKSWISKEIIPVKPDFILGSGGNINKVFDYLNQKTGKFITYKTFKETYTFFSGLSLRDRIYQLGFNPNRADVIIPASEIYLFIMKTLSIDLITVSGIGLKEGIMQELVQQNLLQIKSNLNNTHE